MEECEKNGTWNQQEKSYCIVVQGQLKELASLCGSASVITLLCLPAMISIHTHSRRYFLIRLSRHGSCALLVEVLSHLLLCSIISSLLRDPITFHYKAFFKALFKVC